MGRPHAVILSLVCVFGCDRFAPCSGLVITLDDADDSGVGHHNSHTGSQPECLEDAYRGQFRHDNGINKGNANVSFTFDPPRDGCYSIEEYHPGGNQACARLLSSATRLNVDFCLGLHAHAWINQASQGGRWNMLGKLPFYRGNPGRLTLSNSAHNSCSAGTGCLWVADAFRLTWLATSCKDAEQGGHNTQSSQATTTSTPQAQVVSTTGPHTHGGSTTTVADSYDAAAGFGMFSGQAADPDETIIKLKLQVKLAEQGDSSAQDQVAQHNIALETALVAHFGFASVRVLSIASSHSTPGRRLSGSAIELWIHFAAKGDSSKSVGDDEKLRQALQRELDKANAGLVVLIASTPDSSIVISSPLPVPATEPTMPEKDSIALPLGISVGVVFLMSFFGIAAFMWKRRGSQEKVPTSAAGKPDMDKEGETDLKGKADDADENGVRSASEIGVEIIADSQV